MSRPVPPGYTVREVLRGGDRPCYRAWSERHALEVFLKKDDRAQVTVELLRQHLRDRDSLALAPFDWAQAKDGARYSVAPWQSGSLLSSMLQQERLTETHVLELARALGESLDALDQVGLVHGDIKAENILVDSAGRYYLSDFDTLQAVNSPAPEQIHGTPHTMSPECVCRKPLSPASDRYSLGVVLFEALTGVLPFAGDDSAMMRGHLDASPPSVIGLCPTISPVVADLLRQCLEKDPDNRPSSCHEISQTLEQGLVGSRRTESLADLALVVHPQRQARQEWKAHLLTRGWRVRVCGDDFTARRLILSNPPARILLGADLAEESGEDLLRFIRENGATCAIPLQVIGDLGPENQQVKHYSLEVSADGLPAVPDISSQELMAVAIEDTPPIAIPVLAIAPQSDPGIKIE